MIYTTKFLVIDRLVSLTEENLISNPYYLNNFANYLISKGIVETKKTNLLEAINKHKIKNEFDFISYCDKTVQIYFNKYGKEPIDFVEQIYRRTASILPELNFTDFNFKTIKDEEYWNEEQEYYDLEISFRVNGKKYRYDTYFLRNISDSIDIYVSKLERGDYYKIFNHVLSDIGSPYRLKFVNFGDKSEFSDTISIIALKENQEIGEDYKGYSFFDFYWENYFPRMSDKSIVDLIEHLKKVGLFKHISEAEFQDLKTKSIEYGADNQLSVVQRFPNILHSYSYYSEESNSYIDFLKFVDSLSNHSFQFTNYKDNYFDEKKKDIKVTFKVNGKKYTYKDKEKDFWLGNNSKEKFLGFVNQILEENGHKYKFYFISYDEEEMLDFILLTDEQLKYINTHKLLGVTLE
jgi:hypothetical protein